MIAPELVGVDIAEVVYIAYSNAGAVAAVYTKKSKNDPGQGIVLSILLSFPSPSFPPVLSTNQSAGKRP